MNLHREITNCNISTWILAYLLYNLTLLPISTNLLNPTNFTILNITQLESPPSQVQERNAGLCTKMSRTNAVIVGARFLDARDFGHLLYTHHIGFYIYRSKLTSLYINTWRKILINNHITNVLKNIVFVNRDIIIIMIFEVTTGGTIKYLAFCWV